MEALTVADGLFDKLLVPLDGSVLAEQALPYARAFARPATEVTLVQVIAPPEAIVGFGPLVLARRDELLQRERHAAAIYLDETAARWHGAGSPCPVSTVVEVGDAADRILGLAQPGAASMIVMTGHGRGSLGRLAFGSVADRIARRSVVPVFFARATNVPPATGAPAIRRLIVPLDGSARAARALPVAVAAARRLGAPVLVVTVVDFLRVAASTNSGELFNLIVSDMREAAERTVQAATGQLSRQGVAATSLVPEGPAALTIADLAGPGDLIVLTSRGQGGIRRWLIGSVAEHLVHSGPVPILLVPSGD